jgi:hypothetical protein
MKCEEGSEGGTYEYPREEDKKHFSICSHSYYPDLLLLNSQRPAEAQFNSISTSGMFWRQYYCEKSFL